MAHDRPSPFRHAFRVRYAECDPQGVVFNSRYLEYADLVVTAFWRAAGIKGNGPDAFEVHIARAVVDFRAPVRPDEQIEGRAWVERFGNTSMVTRIELWGTGEDSTLRAEIELVQVHVALEDNRPRPIPAAVRAALAG